VALSDKVPIPVDVSSSADVTFAGAAKMSLGTWAEYDLFSDEGDKHEFVVPPVALNDAAFIDVAQFPMKPSEIYPFMEPRYRGEMGKLSETEGGVPFEKSFIAALRGRYYLCLWKQQQEATKAAKDASATAVPLVDVLDGAISPEDKAKLAGIAVDLSGGLESDMATYTEAATAYDAKENTTRKKNTVIWTNAKNPSAHHDAYIAGSKGTTTAPVAIQMRFGAPKSSRELEKQLKQSAGSMEEIIFPLLAVCQVKRKKALGDKMVDVDASKMMGSHLWHYILSCKGMPDARRKLRNSGYRGS
jgi:hypothetical protein